MTCGQEHDGITQTVVAHSWTTGGEGGSSILVVKLVC